MPFVCYERYEPPGPFEQHLLNWSIVIFGEQSEHGYRLSVRQLHYQFVARDLYDNTLENYNALAQVVAKGLWAGCIDWNWIQDRVCNPRGLPHSKSPQEFLTKAIDEYFVDKWRGQQWWPEVWAEKDVLISAIQGVCEHHDVNYCLTCGEALDREVWLGAFMRFRQAFSRGQQPIVLHLADHDPHGLDMTTSLIHRLALFARRNVPVWRIALTLEQIDHYKPPESLDNLRDVRAGAILMGRRIIGVRADSYIDRFSRLDESYPPDLRAEATSSWELEAMDPPAIAQLVDAALRTLRDKKKWNKQVERENDGRKELRRLARLWPKVNIREARLKKQREQQSEEPGPSLINPQPPELGPPSDVEEGED